MGQIVGCGQGWRLFRIKGQERPQNMSTQRTAGFEEWEQQWMEYDTFEEVDESVLLVGTVVSFS